MIEVITGRAMRDIMSPLDQITKAQAIEMLERAFSSLRAHWHAESLTNPIVVAANKALNMDATTSGSPAS